MTEKTVSHQVLKPSLDRTCRGRYCYPAGCLLILLYGMLACHPGAKGRSKGATAKALVTWTFHIFAAKLRFLGASTNIYMSDKLGCVICIGILAPISCRGPM